MASPPEQDPPHAGDPDVQLFEAFVRGVEDFRDWGQVKTGPQQQITIKKPARIALRLEGKSHYWVYGAPRLGVAILTAEPLSGRDDLVARIKEAARKATEAPDDEAESLDTAVGPASNDVLGGPPQST